MFHAYTDFTWNVKGNLGGLRSKIVYPFFFFLPSKYHHNQKSVTKALYRMSTGPDITGRGTGLAGLAWGECHGETLREALRESTSQ